MRSVIAFVSMVAASPDGQIPTVGPDGFVHDPDDAKVQLVSFGLKDLDPDCLQDNCKAPMSNCKEGKGKGGADCEQRLGCAMNRDDFQNCFSGLKWSDLEHDEIKILDCAKESSCMDVSTPGMSLLEIESKNRNLMSHKEYNKQMNTISKMEEMVEGLKSKAIASHKAEAMQKLMIEKASAMVQENREMQKQVAENKDIDAKTKLGLMNTLQEDLKSIKTKLATEAQSMMSMIDSDFTHVPASFAEVRPSSMSEQEAQSGMTAEAAAQMNSLLHKMERGIKEPSLMQAENTDESKEIMQKAQMQKDFEDSFRESYKQEMMKANLRHDHH